ncbi:hypothetical protein RHMOL_Rhmol11G0087700 [Rhododendron molle]|uniref:Uncharacterized protein n=1 Tax=Rhododendron molle TaxID=49168 RepID=A0ACC0LQ12_RHOML|nr:hypothetical protein RHMOL_Rhmol11G0087700 [Rhododendron molle]
MKHPVWNSMASCSQDQRRPDDHHLPNDVLIEILTRLPVKSLLRSKCVCKNWYDLIQNRTRSLPPSKAPRQKSHLPPVFR